MPLPPNTVPMQIGKGPFGPVEMGGMLPVVASFWPRLIEWSFCLRK